MIDDENNHKAYIANKNDNFWRFIYFFPVMINTFMLFSFVIFIKSEPIMFYLSQNRDEEAMITIEKVYHQSEDRKQIL